MLEPVKGFSFNGKTGATYTYYYFSSKSLIEFNGYLFYSKVDINSKILKVAPGRRAEKIYMIY